MNRDDFYFKYLDINYDPADIERFLSAWPIIDNRFEKLDVAKVLDLVPSIAAWFTAKNITPSIAICINHRPWYTQEIHKDDMKDEKVLAINFPLNYQAQESMTRMYSINGEEQPKHKLVQKGPGKQPLPYFYYTEDQVKLVTEYKSISPVLVNVSKPHSAYNCTNFPRGVLTFRFRKDPWILLEQE
jgi:hypothetical protein